MKEKRKYPTTQELARWERSLPDHIRNAHKAVNNPKPSIKPRREGLVVRSSPNVDLSPILINMEKPRHRWQ